VGENPFSTAYSPQFKNDPEIICKAGRGNNICKPYRLIQRGRPIIKHLCFLSKVCSFSLCCDIIKKIRRRTAPHACI
jgi:hypothetical protein